jgi:hypothetical protein
MFFVVNAPEWWMLNMKASNIKIIRTILKRGLPSCFVLFSVSMRQGSNKEFLYCSLACGM